MLKIVIKMRSYKKLINQDLLQLALIISLLKVDPDSYLGLNQGYGYDSGGGVMLGEEPVSYPSPVYPLKDPSQLIQRYQEDILHDLNTLGSFNRFSLYGDVPVQLSAYLVDTDQPCADSGHHTDSDSGISDTERDPGSPCSRTSAQSPVPEDHFGRTQVPDDRFGRSQEGGYGQASAPDNDNAKMDQEEDGSDEGMLDLALDLEEGMFDDDGMMVEYGPQIPQELIQAGIPEIDDHGAIQFELMHMEEQLANLDYNIEDLDEEFIKMDEEIALTFSQDDLVEEEFDMFASPPHPFEAVAGPRPLVAPHPFDVWEQEASSAIPDLLQLENILAEPLFNDQEGTLDLDTLGNLEDLDTMEDLDEFDLDLLESEATENEILRNDVMFSRARDSGDLDDVTRSLELEALPQVFSPETFIRGKSAEEEEEDLVTSLDDSMDQEDTHEVEKTKKEGQVVKEVKEEEEDDEVEVIDQEDLIAQVMKASGILESDIKEEEEEEDDEVLVLQSERTKKIKAEDVKVEDEDEELLQEELLDVVSAEQFEVQMSGGACAQVDLDSLYNRPGKGILSFQPLFNWDAFHHDHGSYAASKLEPADIKLEPEDEEVSELGGRRRNVSESSYSSFSSGYHSSEDSRSTRDEKLAAKVGLPYSVQELVQCPVDRFNEILTNPNLTKQQIKICKDIRRRGKNKVAAQNCRKRKQETIEDLQVQVEAVRRRRAALLREREQLEQERQRWSSKLLNLEQLVVRGMGKNIAEFTLKVLDDHVELIARVGGGEGGRGRGGRSRH